MKLAEKIESSHDVYATLDNPKKLYPLLLTQLNRQIMEKAGADYFQMLWSLVAPTGNIYRYNGFLAERWKHCEDIRNQAMEIAESHKHLLGGETTTRQQRLDLLIKALERVQVHGAWSKQGEHAETPPVPGFHPLQEYMEEEVSRTGPVLQPTDPQARNHHWKSVVIAAFIFGIQVLAPTLVFANRWMMDTNYLRDPHSLFARLTFREAMCLGRTTVERCTTVMGVCFITVIIFVVRLYVSEENENAVKSSRLPTDRFWLTVGIFANMSCCIMTVLCIPLLFWSEETPTNIVLDAMTLLFVFKLDDLSEVLGGFLKMSDNEFQRVTSWNLALLAQCPVRVRDVINHEARSIEDLWCIRFDNAGQLQTAPQPGHDAPSLCETRLMPLAQSAPSENTALVTSDQLLTRKSSKREQVRDGTQDTLPSSRLRYHQCREHSEDLPSMLSHILHTMWVILGWALTILQFVLPPMWFVVSKPCFQSVSKPSVVVGF